MRFRRRDAIARARLTVRANRGGGKLGGTRVIGQLAEETATRDPRRRDGACGALRATDRSPRRPVPTPRTSSRAMATTAWLLAPIRATRPIPTLPGADDALARAGSAACASRKRRLGGSPIEGADASSSRPASTDDPPPAPRRPLGVGRPLPPGDYHLDDDPSAVLRYEPRAMRCAPDAYEELWNFSLAVAPTPNPLNHHLNLRRKQATFGARYRFGAQLSERVDAPRDAWPALVRACIADARARVHPERRDAGSRRTKHRRARQLVPGRSRGDGTPPRRRARSRSRRAHLLVHVHVRRRRVAAAFVRSASTRRREAFRDGAARTRRRVGHGGDDAGGIRTRGANDRR